MSLRTRPGGEASLPTRPGDDLGGRLLRGACLPAGAGKLLPRRRVAQQLLRFCRGIGRNLRQSHVKWHAIGDTYASVCQLLAYQSRAPHFAAAFFKLF